MAESLFIRADEVIRLLGVSKSEAYLIYNDPVAYAELILNGDPETYLKTVTEYKPLHSCPHAARGRKPACGIFDCCTEFNKLRSLPS